MKLRVGVVGLGDQWEGRQLPALRALSDRFAVRAICSAVGERARAAAKEFDADVSDGFRAVVERDDIDVILALSPEWYGPLPILAACDAGKAVYSSAALDLSPDEAAELHQRVEASGIAFMAELPRRHSPATIRLKELIATRLGRPRLMFCHERLPIESGTSRGRQGDHCSLAWRNLMELVDWCRYVVEADPESVISAAHTSCDTGPARFYQMLSLDFPAESVSPNEQNPNEAARPIAQISTGHYIPETWRDAMSFNRPASLQICCENGMAFIDLPSNLIWFDSAGQHTESLEFERPVGEQMLDRFYRAVTSLIRRTTDPQDAYRAMKIVLGAKQSVVDGTRVTLKYDT